MHGDEQKDLLTGVWTDLAASATARHGAFFHKGPGAAFAFELLKIGLDIICICISRCFV